MTNEAGNRTRWLLGFLVAIIACVGTLAVVPEVRTLLGLTSLEPEENVEESTQTVTEPETPIVPLEESVEESDQTVTAKDGYVGADEVKSKLGTESRYTAGRKLQFMKRMEGLRVRFTATIALVYNFDSSLRSIVSELSTVGVQLYVRSGHFDRLLVRGEYIFDCKITWGSATSASDHLVIFRDCFVIG